MQKKVLLFLLMLMLVTPSLAVYPTASANSTDSKVIQNPDFNDYTGTNGLADFWSPINWSSGQASFETLTDYNGVKIQRVTGANINTNEIVGVSQIIDVEPGKPYTLQSRIHVENLQNAIVQMYVDFSNGSGTTGYDVVDHAKATGGFITLTTSGTVPKGTSKARIYILIRSQGSSGSGVVQVDYLNIDYKETSQIYNSDFQRYSNTPTGVINGWYSVNWQANAASYEKLTTPEGNGYQKIGGSGIAPNGNVGIFQYIQVSAGKPFNVQSRIRISSLSQAKVQMYVDFEGDAGYTGSNITEHSFVTDRFITLSNSGVVPTGTKFARVHILIRSLSNNAQGEVFVDSVEFNQNQQALPESILYNPNFNKPYPSNGVAEGWDIWNWQASQSAFETPINSEGKRVQRIQGSGINANGYVSINQSVQLAPGKPYHIKSRLKVESLNNAKVQLYIDFIGVNGIVNAHVLDHAIVRDEYVTLSSSGVVPTDAIAAKVYIIIRSTGVNGAGSILVESMDMNYGNSDGLLIDSKFEQSNRELSSAWNLIRDVSSDKWGVNPSQAGQSAIYEYNNSGQLLFIQQKQANAAVFAAYKYDLNGNLIKRIKAQGTQVVSPLFEGNRSFKLSAWWVKQHDIRGIHQFVKAEPNKLLKVKASVNIQSLYKAKVQLYVDYYNASGQIIDASVTDLAGTTNGSFSNMQLQKTTPPQTAYARVLVILRALEDDAGGVFYVDDVNVTYG
ncbi:hypothetical protein M3223_13365 [Paenibacillus pasadenensis]|uniref:hypothetical protein n=1 Tax=Paenibacillus pasadenensis TaxID=217090 RepID=UPI00203E055B|nr:hypothetical protein [Paenibacillus pasadenensis]MCM3748340.1 hypothetical protein [Paenibacillus pasadenensis]